MSNILFVRWTVASLKAPQPWLPGGRCGGPSPFECSKMFRVNANGTRLDAWLIYRCSGCDSTWNRPVVERRNRRDLDPDFLQALERNDQELADRIAHDAIDLSSKAARVEHFTQASVRKQPMSPNPADCTTVEISCNVAVPTALRIDRLLAAELGLSRTRIESLAAHGRLSVAPEGRKALRRAVRNGMAIRLDLSNEADAAAIALAAAGLNEASAANYQLPAMAADMDCS